MHGFALLPFLLLVFRFSSWFVPLFGYPIYGRRVGGQASVAKERGWLWDGRKYATELLFAYLDWNEKGSMKVFFSHTSLYMRKLSGWFSAFHFLVVWFLLSFVFMLLCWRIGGYLIFGWFEKRFFSEGRGMCGFRGVLVVVFGCFGGVKIELWWSLWWFLRFWSGVGEGCALWRVRKYYLGFGFSDIHKCRFVDHLDAMQRGLLVNHVLMRNRKTMV